MTVIGAVAYIALGVALVGVIIGIVVVVQRRQGR